MSNVLFVCISGFDKLFQAALATICECALINVYLNFFPETPAAIGQGATSDRWMRVPWWKFRWSSREVWDLNCSSFVPNFFGRALL